MLPILNQHLKNNELEIEIEDFIDDEDLEESRDEEIESSSINRGIPLCAEVGLGLIGLGAIGFTVCKLLSSNNNDEV